MKNELCNIVTDQQSLKNFEGMPVCYLVKPLKGCFLDYLPETCTSSRVDFLIKWPTVKRKVEIRG